MAKGLTKENFFDEMMKKYPLATNAFCNFIDVWKLENNWNGIFNAGGRIVGEAEPIAAPKFHEIPLEFQLGLIARFFSEVEGNVFSPEELVGNATYSLSDEWGAIEMLLEEKRIKK